MTAMCSVCHERPAHAQGLCSRCYQRDSWTRCEVCGIVVRSRKRRCADHPPQCAKDDCEAPIAHRAGRYCADHGRKLKNHPECSADGCTVRVRKAGQDVCAQHEKARRRAEARKCATEGCTVVLRTEHDYCSACREGRGRKRACVTEGCTRRVRGPRGSDSDDGLCWECRLGRGLRAKKRQPRPEKPAKAPKPRARKKKREPKPLAPLPPWDPAKLENVKESRPVISGGDKLGGVIRIDPTPARLVRALQSHYLRHDRADLLDALGVTPGDERIPIKEEAAA